MNVHIFICTTSLLTSYLRQYFIIYSTGQSNSMSATASEAAKLRAMGVTVFSIGVGSGAKMSELNAMATDPDNSHVFTVTNFNSLNTIKGTLAKQTCQGLYAFAFHLSNHEFMWTH